MKHVTIIGGGITGLAAAFYLQREAASRDISVRYTLLDAGAHWGGKIFTARDGEFVIEAGPDSFIVEKPAALQLCHDVGLGEALIPSNEIDKRVYVLKRGKLVPFPAGFRLTIPTAAGPFLKSPLISPLGKLRMAADLVIPARRSTEDESLASFIRRRFGRECLDRIAGPLLGGIFVSDPERLSMQATFPRLIEMERKHGSLIRAARAARRAPPPKAGPRPAGRAMFNSLRDGMGSLAQAIVKTLNGELRLRTRAAQIQWENGRPHILLEDGSGWATDSVILAVPADRAAALLDDSAPALAQELSAIRFISTATVSLGYRIHDVPAECPLDGFGVLIPAVEQRALIAVTWSSTKFVHRAPPDHVLLRAFVGGYHDEERAFMPDDALVDMVRRELRQLFGIRAPPLVYRIYRWPHANPQYEVGHLDRVARIEALAANHPGLHLAGSSYRGVGLPDCIQSARAAVDRVLRE